MQHLDEKYHELNIKLDLKQQTDIERSFFFQTAQCVLPTHLSSISPFSLCAGLQLCLIMVVSRW